MSTFTYPAFVAKDVVKTTVTSGNGFKCPNCGTELRPINAGKIYSCDNNHSFDRAKEGYLNLLLAQHKRSRNPGDSDEMIRSRQRFLNAGYYQILASAIIEQIPAMAADSRLLDIGCGEGYYLQAINKARNDLQLVGIDISKTAVRLAAKRRFPAQLAVDSGFNLALFDNSIDCAISVFSPIGASEAARVLKPEGLLIMVGPGEQHLSGLTAYIYDNPVPHGGNFKAVDKSTEFSLIGQTDIQQSINIEGSAIGDLLRMTPYYWHATPAQQKSLGKLDKLETEVHFNIRLYQNDSVPA
jgi:23S rRNA (guanine745-N1)-methyltransferase